MKISKWTETFEGSESRRPKTKMLWYLHPVDLMSRGTIELTSMGSDGLIALAVFNLLCQWTAGQSIVSRGNLTHSDGTPLGSEYLSKAINVTKPNIEKSLGILIKMGWLVQTCTNSYEPVQTCTQEESRGDETIVEEKTEDKNGVFEFSFDLFWGSYPKRVGKKVARESFRKALKEVDAGTIISAAQVYRDSDVGHGPPQYLKAPATWLNQGCWDDDPESLKVKSTPAPVTFAEQARINTANNMQEWAEEQRLKELAIEQAKLTQGESNEVPRISNGNGKMRSSNGQPRLFKGNS